MTEKPDILPLSQASRHCPACGIQVAAMASECLMCGVSLAEDGEPERVETRDAGRIPGWIGSVVAVVVGLAILAGGGLGIYRLLAIDGNSEPENPVATETPTRTPTQTPTPADALPPTSTPTPLPPQVHTVQEGETMSEIAKHYQVTVSQILALNKDVESEVVRAGRTLLIPPTLVEGGMTVHVVQEGESLGRIAVGYGVPLSLILTANDMRTADEAIRPGQSLIIPLTQPTPPPTPTAGPEPTWTPLPEYVPPPLLSPPDGTIFADGEAPVLLQWASVGILRSQEWYELSISQPARGVVCETIRTRSTAWRVPLDLLQKAAVDVPQFYWQVRVVREIGDGIFEQAGDPSPIRSFVWREPAPPATSGDTP